MRMLERARFAALATCFLLHAGIVLGQSPSSRSDAQSEVKEVSVASDVFTRGDPIPVWVSDTAIPPMLSKRPFVIRLADTQFWITETHFYLRSARHGGE